MTTETVLSESRLRSFKAQALGNGRRPALTPIELSLVQQAYAYALQSPEVQRLREDAERLDWLEVQINEHGAIHLHDGTKPYGLGIGLRPGILDRSLRAAIDASKGG